MQPQYEPLFKDLEANLLRVVAEAQRSLKVAVAWFTHPAMANLLIQLAQKGVRVTVILQDDRINREAGVFAWMEATGISVLWAPADAKGIMHQKFCLIDDACLAYGSCNWTKKGLNHNHETLTLVRHDPQFIAPFVEQFDILVKLYDGIAQEESALPDASMAEEQLRADIRLLEVLIAETETAIAEAEQLASQFNQAYISIVGGLLRLLLRLNMELAAWKAKLSEKREHEEAFAQAKETFEQWTANHEAQTPPPVEIPQAEKEDLRALFREATKLCHPDLIADPSLKEQAASIFRELREAYNNQDVKRVKEILEDLRMGIAWYRDVKDIDSLAALQALHKRLSEKYEALQAQLRHLQTTEPMPTIAELADRNEPWEVYFEGQKRQIQRQVKEKERELKAFQR